MSGRVIRSAVAWSAAAAAVAVGLGLASAVVQERFAPLVLFPILQGIALGTSLVLALRATQFGSRRWAMAAAVAATAILFAAQFYGSYRRYVAAVEGKNPGGFVLPHERLRPPGSLTDYLRQQSQTGRPLFGEFKATGRWVWVTWVLDLALAAAATVLVVRFGFRRPYCTKCHKWYRAMGEGSLNPQSVDRVAQLVGADLPSQLAHYRLWTCPTAGHGTTLEIAWPPPSKAGPRGAAAGQGGPAADRPANSAANRKPAPSPGRPPRATMLEIPQAKATRLNEILAGQSESA